MINRVVANIFPRSTAYYQEEGYGDVPVIIDVIEDGNGKSTGTIVPAEEAKNIHENMIPEKPNPDDIIESPKLGDDIYKTTLEPMTNPASNADTKNTETTISDKKIEATTTETVKSTAGETTEPTVSETVKSTASEVEQQTKNVSNNADAKQTTNEAQAEAKSFLGKASDAIKSHKAATAVIGASIIALGIYGIYKVKQNKEQQRSDEQNTQNEPANTQQTQSINTQTVAQPMSILPQSQPTNTQQTQTAAQSNNIATA